MEGATATFAMFVPEPLAPADLGIAQAYYEVCAQRMMEELSDEDKLEMYFISRAAYFLLVFLLKGTTKVNIQIMANKFIITHPNLPMHQ